MKINLFEKFIGNQYRFLFNQKNGDMSTINNQYQRFDNNNSNNEEKNINHFFVMSKNKLAFLKIEQKKDSYLKFICRQYYFITIDHCKLGDAQTKIIQQLLLNNFFSNGAKFLILNKEDKYIFLHYNTSYITDMDVERKNEINSIFNNENYNFKIKLPYKSEQHNPPKQHIIDKIISNFDQSAFFELRHNMPLFILETIKNIK